MSARIFISHAAAEAALGENVAEFLQAMIEGAHVRAAAGSRVPEAGDGSAALQQDLSDADLVIALVTEAALASGEVPFHLGAAWALDTRILLLIGHDGVAAEAYLPPIAQVETRNLGPEALVELADSLAREAGAAAEMGTHARTALGRLFPEFAGLDRQSSERLVTVPRDSSTTQPQWPLNEAGEPVPPERRLQPVSPPSCSASLLAGRAISDCVFHREDGGRFADELDPLFGTFLTSLGANWNTLREINDLDVWAEAAENVLQALGPGDRHVRSFYEVGFQLSKLINLAHRALEVARDAEEPRASWQPAWSALREAALAANVAPTAVDELHPMLENLYGPHAQRDVANLGRVQERVREFAAQADAAALAASA